MSGVNTDGQVWQFGKLDQDVYTYNAKLFTLDNLADLLGALDYMYARMKELSVV